MGSPHYQCSDPYFQVVFPTKSLTRIEKRRDSSTQNLMSLERQQGAGRLLPSVCVYTAAAKQYKSVRLVEAHLSAAAVQILAPLSGPLHKQPPSVPDTHACTLPTQLHSSCTDTKCTSFKKEEERACHIFLCVLFLQFMGEARKHLAERKKFFKEREKEKRILAPVIPFLCVTLDLFFLGSLPVRDYYFGMLQSSDSSLPGRLVSKECACASNFFSCPLLIH